MSVIILASVAGTLIFTTQLNANADTNSTDTTPSPTVTSDTNSTTPTSTPTETATDNTTTPVETNTTDNSTSVNFGCFKHAIWGFPQHGGFGQVEVSDEFKQNVTSIASADSDVQNLLNTGYNVTSVTPIFKTVVDGNGHVTTQASTAILTLVKDEPTSKGRATVVVDIDQAKVTTIYIGTRTIIQK